MEIAGEAAYRADCSDAATLAEALAHVLSDEDLRQRMIQLGYIQAQPFTIEKCAEATIRVYQEALGIAPPHAPLTATDGPSAESEGQPPVSVIVPTSRPELASQTLASLARQSYQGKVETIVVGVLAQELVRQWPVIPVALERPDTPGKARNLGAARASGDALLFLDDDCAVAEDWIARNVRALQQPQVGVVGARIRGKSRAFFARCVDFTNFGYYQQRSPKDGPVASASMGVWRSVFEVAGGFDERLSSSEDIDFCYRVQKQGYRTIYRPDIIIAHDHQRDTLGKLLRYNYGRGFTGGLATKVQHRDIGLKNRLLYSVRFPAIFLLLLPLIALMATAQTVAVNITENPGILVYAPFILLGKMAYEYGVFREMLARKQSKTQRKSFAASS
jgi:glycosyltransferase involved in cell wall biosynthesis